MKKDTSGAPRRAAPDYGDMHPSDIRRMVARDLNQRTIPDGVWEHVVKHEFVRMLQRGDGPDEANYRALKDRVQELNTMIRKEAQAKMRQIKGRKLARRPVRPLHSISENVRLMTKALYDSEDPTIDAIFCTLESGQIVVEADLWVPADSIERAYREIQQFVLGGARNETVQDSTLERYNWVRNRRNTRKESWEETRKAWEKTGGKESRSARQFGRDFRRTAQFLDRVEAFRDKALQQEYEGGALQQELPKGWVMATGPSGDLRPGPSS